MPEAYRHRGDPVDPVLAAADRAAEASRDAGAAARSAAGTALAAEAAARAAGVLAVVARHATAAAVAAAASSTADLAAKAAVAVETESVIRALRVAASAVEALEKVAAELADDAEPREVSRAAAAMAATVAAAAATEARATADAAATVAAAVATAARRVARDAADAAASVDQAADAAAATGSAVTGSSAATEAASDRAVASTTRVAELAPRLRVVAALRRAGVFRHAPLVAELEHALSHAELRLHYQPVYSLASGAVIGTEALLRWQHPTRGLLHPGEFLDVAEARPLLVPVGDWILATAIEQAARWQADLGPAAPRMWVNVAAGQLGDQHVPAVVERCVARHGLSPNMVGIEVTERQLVRSADAAAIDLLALRELGVGLAVDDFGTGFASLDYLRRFSFDALKIDRSFVAGLGQDRTDTAVTSSIIALGRALDLTVVAEGVERQAQLDQLKQFGCTEAQGYLMQRPGPPETIRWASFGAPSLTPD